MASIKDNIKQELLNRIAKEQDNCIRRQSLSESSQESFQIMCERNFLSQLEEFVRSI